MSGNHQTIDMTGHDDTCVNGVECYVEPRAILAMILIVRRELVYYLLIWLRSVIEFQEANFQAIPYTGERWSL